MRVLFFSSKSIFLRKPHNKEESEWHEHQFLPLRPVESVVLLVVNCMKLLHPHHPSSQRWRIVNLILSQSLHVIQQFHTVLEGHLLSVDVSVFVAPLILLSMLMEIQVVPHPLSRCEQMFRPLRRHNNYNQVMPSLRATSFRM